LTTLRLGPPGAPSLPSPAELAELANRSPFAGLTPTQLSRLAELNASTDDAASTRLAARSLSAVTSMADSEARKMGLLIDWRSPAARPVLLDCLRAFRTAHADLVKREEGDGAPIPQAPDKARKAVPVKLRDVFERWKGTKKRSEDSVRACERALALFEDRTGDTPVWAITRAHGDDFRSWLQTLGTSAKTAHDRLTWVKSLLVHAHRDLGLIAPQPWEGIDIEHHAEKPRKAWSDDELRAFYSLPLFTRHALPTTAKAGADAAYWVPLLGLYTGARVSELCQLVVSDVEAGKHGAVIRIAEEAEGADVKSTATHRSVPVHSELVRLGFLDYVAARKTSGATSLWPRMPMRKGKPGAYFSDWINPFHRQATGNPKAPAFHELRDTVRTALHCAGVDRETIGWIIGHERGLSQARRAKRACTHASNMDLRAAVEALKFSAVRLRRVWR
jgi:integrase